MNHSALRPVIGVACLASLTAVSISAMEIEQAYARDDLQIGAELLNKQYDQGIVRNNDVTLHERAVGRYFDFGVILDLYQVIGEDGTLPREVQSANVPKYGKTGETTQMNLRFDYLIEMKDYFQILPYFEWINYPYLREMPLKDQQMYLGVDAWYLTPLPGVELGASMSYDPFYKMDDLKGGADGWAGNHLLRGSIGSRQFIQSAPVDITLWQMFNFGNESYNRMIGAQTYDSLKNPGKSPNDQWTSGLNIFDIGIAIQQPLPWRDWWLTTKLEGHFWITRKDRELVADSYDRENKDYVMAIGVKWSPTAEGKGN